MKQKYKILIVEDSAADAELAEREVRKVLSPCRCSTVKTREALIHALESFVPDIVLSDFSMPDLDGLAVIRLTLEKSPFTPVLIVTGSINEDTAVRCIKEGAADYILKEHLKRLGPALLGALKRKDSRIRHYETQAALIESEERFRRLAENAEDLIYRYEFLPRRGFTYVSPTAVKITGYSPEEYYADPDLGMKIVHPEDVHMIQKCKADQFRDKASLSLRLVRKDGTIVWIEQKNVPLRDGDGNLVAIEGIARDVTKRRLAEEALRNSEERYRTFFENDLSGDFIAGADGRIISCNPSLAKILGYDSADELVNLNISQFSANKEQLEELFSMIGGRKPVEFFKMELLCKNKRPVHVVANAYGTFNQAGELVEIVGYVNDETRLRQLERQVIESQKLESLGTLTGGIAHDFNNLLTIIIGHLELLDGSFPENDTVTRTLGIIRTAAERGVALVKQLLTFARKTEAVFIPVDINETIAEVITLLTETIPKTISITFNRGEKIPAASVDPTQIQQVLINLCVNARDAMPERGALTISSGTAEVGLLVTRFPAATADTYIVMRVTDTGSGMDVQTQSRIFEPFFTTKIRGAGTGLGLSTVYGIVKNHRGFIDVRSEPGKGTTFSVYLPVQKIFSPKSESGIGNKRDSPGGNETILIIEDERTLREYLNIVLKTKGYHVMTAEDGEAGVRVYRDRKNVIDIVVSDIDLPKLDGGKVFRMIRDINPEAKLILMSGFIDPDFKSRIRGAGAKHFIDKPFSSQAMLEMIRNVLDKAVAS